MIMWYHDKKAKEEKIMKYCVNKRNGYHNNNGNNQ